MINKAEAINRMSGIDKSGYVPFFDWKKNMRFGRPSIHLETLYEPKHQDTCLIDCKSHSIQLVIFVVLQEIIVFNKNTIKSLKGNKFQRQLICVKCHC